MVPRNDDPLQPELERAQASLADALAEACSVDVARANTGEMIRVEETLAIAGEAAKRVISIRRKLGRDHHRAAGHRSDRPTTDVTTHPAAPGDQPDAAPAHRVFRDLRGIEWRSYAVYPVREGSGRAWLPEVYRSGWLAFEADAEKRRLSPIPEGWQSLPDEHLAALCERAEIVPRRSRPRDADGGRP